MRHCTHDWVDTWQIGFVPEQVDLSLHCTHTPLVVLQIDDELGHWELLVHGAVIALGGTLEDAASRLLFLA
jgi:hypothetical protein